MNSKFDFLARKPRKFLRLERMTIAERQGMSEDQKFAAKLTQSKNQILSSFVYKEINMLSAVSVPRNPEISRAWTAPHLVIVGGGLLALQQKISANLALLAGGTLVVRNVLMSCRTGLRPEELEEEKICLAQNIAAISAVAVGTLTRPVAMIVAANAGVFAGLAVGSQLGNVTLETWAVAGLTFASSYMNGNGFPFEGIVAATASVLTAKWLSDREAAARALPV